MRIAVVGGGAAGMMAAIAAAEQGAQVTLLEKNEKLGKKLFITGKGRCNVTNACDRQEFFTHIYSNPRFMYSSFGRFGNYDMMELIEEAGTPLKTERGNRVFPCSDKSSDILKALELKLRREGVHIELNARVTELLAENGAVSAVRYLVRGREELLEADRVILATGGLSYPQTGSDGDGYRFARAFGHSIVPTRPCLVPFEADFLKAGGMKPRDIMGLSLKNIAVRITRGGKELCSDFGEMLFTHFGVSGPVILTASGRIGQLLEEKNGGEPVLLHIDLKPALSPEQLEERYLRETETGQTRQINTYLGGWLPKALIPVILKIADVPENRKLAELSRKQREAILTAMKDLTLRLNGLRGYAEAIVTQGGVSVKELQPATMESKKVKGLYMAGELLDVDAETGGYNLQIAWSTGHAAGLAAAKEEEL